MCVSSSCMTDGVSLHRSYATSMRRACPSPLPLGLCIGVPLVYAPSCRPHKFVHSCRSNDSTQVKELMGATFEDAAAMQPTRSERGRCAGPCRARGLAFGRRRLGAAALRCDVASRRRRGAKGNLRCYTTHNAGALPAAPRLVAITAPALCLHCYQKKARLPLLNASWHQDIFRRLASASPMWLPRAASKSRSCFAPPRSAWPRL